ncbi:dienelactone hydrolase endo-1,3,1,4-beta-D-glucanase [Dendrothele bispora CBS 962.96]|uniref:Dienelactone hydrolase endo-1,3,1,4-beta-D-glucanase n=1 Tax=Dendrothele bispora (strain CBS 962.96) TaxID=1314807 RepID=A0A4S8LR84_DENBC|nr:dienelactone hydrolase endo-1,3,1,4-beta-D-glucanase [Dendrothele bispora CBS 962.96]
MSLCDDCVKGVTHEGTPSGSFETINGVKCYVATPEGDYDKTKVLLFLTDVFGMKLNNNLLLADDFARNGYKTVMPDYLNDDPIPVDAMEKGEFDITKWFPNHGAEQTRPGIDKVVEALKGQGVEKFSATGYCFGARYVFDLAFTNLISVSVVSHPSLLKVPDDIQNYLSSSKAPLLINSCTIDQMFPMENAKITDEILGEGKFAPGYKRAFFEGMTHGFAVRGDMSKKEVKEAKEGAFKEAVMWLKKYF